MWQCAQSFDSRRCLSRVAEPVVRPHLHLWPLVWETVRSADVTRCAATSEAKEASNTSEPASTQRCSSAFRSRATDCVNSKATEACLPSLLRLVADEKLAAVCGVEAFGGADRGVRSTQHHVAWQAKLGWALLLVSVTPENGYVPPQEQLASRVGILAARASCSAHARNSTPLPSSVGRCPSLCRRSSFGVGT